MSAHDYRPGARVPRPTQIPGVENPSEVASMSCRGADGQYWGGTRFTAARVGGDRMRRLTRLTFAVVAATVLLGSGIALAHDPVTGDGATDSALSVHGRAH